MLVVGTSVEELSATPVVVYVEEVVAVVILLEVVV